MANIGNKFINDHILIVNPTPQKSKKVPEKPKIYVDKIKNGWTMGYVRYKNKNYGFGMKNFIEPSVFGINKGCISKLHIVDGKNSGKTLVNYERGWDIRPDKNNADLMKVYRALLSKFNRNMPIEYQEQWMKS